nr:MAG TPA: hypothetical protein [Caudoviricetes sp.]
MLAQIVYHQGTRRACEKIPGTTSNRYMYDEIGGGNGY